MGSTFREYEATAGRVSFPVAARVWIIRAVVSMALALLLTAGILAARDTYFLYFGGLVVVALFIAAVRMVVKATRAIGSGRTIAPAGSRIYLFDSGFVHSGLVRSGNHVARAFLWSEISVYLSGAGAHYLYSMVRPGERWTSIQLSSTDWDAKDVEELGRAIMEGVKAAQVPQVLAAVRGGRRVRFGEHLTVERRGLRSSGLQRWDRIEHVYVAGDEFVVNKVGRFFKHGGEYPAWIIPNVFVLEAVAATLIRDAANHG